MPEQTTNTNGVGNRAPEFTLTDQNDNQVTLASLLEQGPLVLYFYPKDESAGCTAEACGFRDSFEDFVAAGARVVGVSADSPASHRNFAAHHRLPFTLLSDRGNRVRRAYGVTATFGIIPGRETFIIDRQGVIRHRFSAQMQPLKHIAESLRILAELKDESSATTA